LSERPPRRPGRSQRSSAKKQFVSAKGKTRHLKNQVSQGTFVAFDIETTGGNPERNGITEICAIKVKEGRILGRFYSLVNPKRNIPPIVRRMTGITNKMVKDAPLIETVMPNFIKFIGEGILVSHNTIGDMKFLRYFSEKTNDEMILNYFLCTHLLTEKLIPEAPDKSLKGLRDWLKLDSAGEHHRAEADAEVTLSLFEHLCSLLAKKNIDTISEAIRVQGDYESTIRLGWSIPREKLQALPREPGVFFLHDQKGRIIFLSAAKNIAKDVKLLAKLQLLPRQLIKSVASSTDVTYSTKTGMFSAALHEAKNLCKHKIKYTPADWHQRVAQFLFTKPDGKDTKLIVGPLQPGATWAIGPIKGGRGIGAFMEEIAQIFNKKPSKRSINLSKTAGRLVENLLRGKTTTKAPLSFFPPLLLLSRFRQKQKTENMQLKELQKLTIPKELNQLQVFSGVLAVPLENSWEVYSISAGTPRYEGSYPGIVDPNTATKLGKKLYPKIRKRSLKIGKKPLSAWEAHTISRVLWWLQFGPDRRESHFFNLEVLSKF